MHHVMENTISGIVNTFPRPLCTDGCAPLSHPRSAPDLWVTLHKLCSYTIHSSLHPTVSSTIIIIISWLHSCTSSTLSRESSVRRRFPSFLSYYFVANQVHIYISWSYIFWLFITAATHRLLVVIFVLLCSNRKDRRREDE